MAMRDRFEEPEMEIVMFTSGDVDVVTSSGTGFFRVDPEVSDK